MRTRLATVATVVAAMAGSSAAQSIGEPIELDGLIEPKTRVIVSAAIEGVVETVLVDRGDVVKVGQILATLEASVEKEALEVARLRATAAGTLPALSVIVFSESDTVGHHYWRDHDPQSPRHTASASESRRSAIARVYEALDQACGELRSAFGEDALCVVLSDHGMGGASRTVVHLNRFLAERGFWHDGGCWRAIASPAPPETPRCGCYRPGSRRRFFAGRVRPPAVSRAARASAASTGGAPVPSVRKPIPSPVCG